MKGIGCILLKALLKSRKSCSPKTKYLYMVGFQSGQMEQTVNLLSEDFGGSNPPPTTITKGTYNLSQEMRFARLDDKKYVPFLSNSREVINTKQRLWMFLIVQAVIEKQKLLNLKFVKHSSLQNGEL